MSCYSIASRVARRSNARPFPHRCLFCRAWRPPARPAPIHALRHHPVAVRSAPTAPRPCNQVASSVTVITAQEIETKQERNLPDVLRDVPGLNLIQTGGPGGTTSIFIRGANSDQTKVLIDGIEVTDPPRPTAYSSSRTPHLRRPAGRGAAWSAERALGADAIGGVIDVVTRTGSGPLHGDVTFEGGMFSTFDQTGEISGSLDRFSYALDLSHPCIPAIAFGDAGRAGVQGGGRDQQRRL